MDLYDLSATGVTVVFSPVFVQPRNASAANWYLTVTHIQVILNNSEAHWEAIVAKVIGLLRSVSTSKVAMGSTVFMFAYMVKNSSIGCPICGGQGIHPWEWGGMTGI